MAPDKRINAFRPDLAAAHLRGKVDAARFVEGTKACVAIGRTSLRVQPTARAAQDSELLFGEAVTVYERKDGWAWVQAADDQYVGYVRDSDLTIPFKSGARVSALSAPVFSAPDLKSPLHGIVPMNAGVPVEGQDGDYTRIAPDAWIHARHLLPETETDFVAVAERFLGAPYVWGGKTVGGLDCSGLIQSAMQAAGVQIPRDTDMQESFFTVDADTPRRGDLVFWKGHMGVMLDATRLLHANAHHMLVAIEPLVEAQARIAGTPAGPITSVKRPTARA